jgi:hypothetical protein
VKLHSFNLKEYIARVHLKITAAFVHTTDLTVKTLLACISFDFKLVNCIKFQLLISQFFILFCDI